MTKVRCTFELTGVIDGANIGVVGLDIEEHMRDIGVEYMYTGDNKWELSFRSKSEYRMCKSSIMLVLSVTAVRYTPHPDDEYLDSSCF